MFILSLAIISSIRSINSFYTSILFCMLFLNILPFLYDLGFFVLVFFVGLLFDSQLLKVSKFNGLLFLFFGTICAFNVTFLHKLPAYLHMFSFNHLSKWPLATLQSLLKSVEFDVDGVIGGCFCFISVSVAYHLPKRIGLIAYPRRPFNPLFPFR